VAELEDRIVPKISQQYRREQTDLFLLERARRIRFERDAFFDEVVAEYSSVVGEAGGMLGSSRETNLMMAKCPAGCKCGR